LYLFFRTFAELFPAAVVALLDAAVLFLTAPQDRDLAPSPRCSNFGTEHLWGLVALALFSPLCGYLMDIHVVVFGFVDFAAAFYALAALMIITAVLAAVLPIQADSICRSWWRDMWKV
jgi:hypothetical protein